MRAFLRGVAAAALGAAAMYYFDSQLGKRRRAMLRDKMGATSRRIRKSSQAQARKVAGRAYGMLHNAVSSAPASDLQLTERARSRLGHVIANPRSVDVRVDHGVACVGGEVPAADHDRVIREIAAVPGIERIEDCLSVHDDRGNLPGLQGVARHGRN
ncbi:BON domain-containing protein [Paraburkholderia sp. LEh10]|uniref:BON domain-containing protein n=1 Tax=Paraburkholderia sp. LEh10 TaxID=2821353 RepID=UPI001AE50D1C|nr:BON domain-containing protein [Paraburkholderia sp. LEh10]MBP0588292.1 BON domain-containing protein [Paraburkholderia sp. LEh10]